MKKTLQGVALALLILALFAALTYLTNREHTKMLWDDMTGREKLYGSGK